MNKLPRRLFNSGVFFSISAVSYNAYEWIVTTSDYSYSTSIYALFYACFCLGVFNLVAFFCGVISSHSRGES